MSCLRSIARKKQNLRPKPIPKENSNDKSDIYAKGKRACCQNDA